MCRTGARRLGRSRSATVEAFGCVESGEQFTLCPWVRVRQLLADKARTEGEKAASLAYFARAAHPHRAGLGPTSALWREVGHGALHEAVEERDRKGGVAMRRAEDHAL
jgi:hypothetical protein